MTEPPESVYFKISSSSRETALKERAENRRSDGTLFDQGGLTSSSALASSSAARFLARMDASDSRFFRRCCKRRGVVP